jgi:hypothetical protein
MIRAIDKAKLLCNNCESTHEVKVGCVQKLCTYFVDERFNERHYIGIVKMGLTTLNAIYIGASQQIDLKAL